MDIVQAIRSCDQVDAMGSPVESVATTSVLGHARAIEHDGVIHYKKNKLYMVGIGASGEALRAGTMHWLSGDILERVGIHPLAAALANEIFSLSLGSNLTKDKLPRP